MCSVAQYSSETPTLKPVLTDNDHSRTMTMGPAPRAQPLSTFSYSCFQTHEQGCNKPELCDSHSPMCYLTFKSCFEAKSHARYRHSLVWAVSLEPKVVGGHVSCPPAASRYLRLFGGLCVSALFTLPLYNSLIFQLHYTVVT